MDGPPHGWLGGAPVGESPAGLERRMILRLLGYWRAAFHDNEIPLLTSIDPREIPDIWPYCYVLDVAGHQHDPVLSFVGRNLLDEGGADLTGAPVSAIPAHTLLGASLRYVPEVMRKGVPVSRGSEVTRPDGARILFRTIILPLSADGRSLGYLLGAANSRDVATT